MKEYKEMNGRLEERKNYTHSVSTFSLSLTLYTLLSILCSGNAGDGGARSTAHEKKEAELYI